MGGLLLFLSACENEVLLFSSLVGEGICVWILQAAGVHNSNPSSSLVHVKDVPKGVFRFSALITGSRGVCHCDPWLHTHPQTRHRETGYNDKSSESL